MVEPEWYCKIMVDAPNPLGVHPTSISYVCKVFHHLDMLWMGIWVHPYTVTLVQERMNFRKNGVWLSPSDVVRSWLRLKTTVDCIPFPDHMYIQSYITLLCCGWSYRFTLTLLCLCRWGWISRKIRVWLSLSDVVRSCLRLQTHLECITYPYHVFTKCYSTLLSCG